MWKILRNDDKGGVLLTSILLMQARVFHEGTRERRLCGYLAITEQLQLSCILMTSNIKITLTPTEKNSLITHLCF